MDFFILRTWLLARSRYGEPRSRDGERGAGLVEYVLLVTGIACLVIGALYFFRERVQSKYSSVGSSIT